jgi:nucleoside-diphosphate kinase
MSNMEQTLSIIKPDAVERNLDNEIKEMFKNKGFNIIKDKKIQIAKSEAEQFYKVHETKPFYNDLCTYLSSGPIVVMVLEKENAVLGNRELMGATKPEDAAEGTIRKKYGISIDKNSVHGSDSVENAKIEIDLCSCFKTFFATEAEVSLTAILIFFCIIIFPESNFAVT